MGKANKYHLSKVLDLISTTRYRPKRVKRETIYYIQPKLLKEFPSCGDIMVPAVKLFYGHDEINIENCFVKYNDINDEVTKN